MAQIILVGQQDAYPKPNPPHGPSPVLTGSSNLTVNGRPVALVGDTCACACKTPNPVITGNTSLTINGIPVATTGSQTAHGGVFLDGDGALTIQ